MQIRHSYQLFVVVFTFFFVILGLVVFKTFKIQDDLVRQEQHRFRSFLLAIELFQSSEDLTRMARSYVSTGNPIYEQRYFEILDIRNGQRPRPAHYTATYWHLAGAGKGRAVASGETVALQELMRREGFTEKEFGLLRESQKNSDRLVRMEEQAFAAVKGLYDDGQGNFTVRRAPDRDFAIGLLFSEKYFDEKARIMAPLQQCLDEIDERTQAALNASAFKLRQFILLALVLVLIALLGVEMKFAHAFRVILHPIERLRKRVGEVAMGNYAARCDVSAANEIGELCGLFNQMAASLETDILRRQRAEATLKKSEEQVRLLLNSTAEAIYGIDLQDNCTFANPACLKMLGYADMQQLLGQNMHRLIHHSYPGGRPMPVEVCKIYRAFREGQGVHVDDEVLWKADGASFAAEYWSYPQTADGKVTGAVVTFVDITRRKQAEEALTQSRRFLSDLIEHSGALICVKDRDSRYTLVNRKWEEATGWKRDEALGRTVEELFPGAVGRQLRANDLKVMEAGSLLEQEEILEDAHGQRFFIAIKFPLRGDGGAIEGICGMMTEITRRKQAEAALALERQRLAYILEGTNVGTWEWNVQSGATKFNERWAEIIGYTLAELEPVSIETWMKLAHPDDLKKSGALLEKHFQKKLPYYECESRMRHKDGHWIWVQDRGKVATWTPDGKPLVMCGTHQDITARKAAEEMVVYMERIFLHDVMNTAVALRGFSDLIKEGDVDRPTEQKFLQSVSFLAGRVIDEINAHRELMAAEQKNLVVKKEPIDSRPFLTDLYNTYNRADMLNNRELQMDAASQSVNFTSDKTLLGRVVGNMIKNAIEASSAGERITIGCFAKDNRIHFWVHNPAYMPENIRAQIFTRSFTTKGAGRGLGTYSMKFLTEQYLQGRISFVSTEGQGTTFTAEYPLA